ncbi:MAG: glycosyltransferase family 4 protein [Verrucomicrobia bacterium]|nr:glycosyltransferase family 4 protein [Verrucomicrobiota bacterium]MBS0646730.1 glycosyltransferase family 4 protein [Verrucomicrobiota bacterium]
MKITLLKSHMTASGGLEKVTSGLVQAFNRKGLAVTLLTTEGRSTESALLRVINLGYRSKFSLKHHQYFDAACQIWLQQNPQDIVFGLERNSFQTHYRAGSGVHAAYLRHRAQHQPEWQTLSNVLNPFHRFLLKLEKKAFTSPQLKRIFTNSLMVKQELQEFYDVEENKLMVVPNGVDWHSLESVFIANKPVTPFTFLFIGNDYRRKGLPFILKALPLLSSYDFRILVVGKDRHPQHFTSSPHVHFLGPVKDLIPLYQQAHALLIPSLYDPFANVTVEALAMGLFVVSSRFNGGHEILTPHMGTVIEQLDDPESVAASMRLALACTHDPLSLRKSVQGLDFSQQLDKIVHTTLHD